MNVETYKFADFELDSAKRALLKNGNIISLNPKAFDLLVYLVANQGEVISKDDLINNVWNGQIVEENNITVQVSILRKALGDDARSATFLKTIPGNGYKFVADVQIVDDEEIIFEKHSISKLILEEEQTEEDSVKNIPHPKPKLHKGRSLRISPLAIFALIAVFLLTGVLAFRFWNNKNNSTKYSLVKTDKLTTSGKITNLVITPNGEYFVYSQKEGIGESLWLKHLKTGGQQQILPPQSAKFVGLTVSPDGNFIYFSRFGNEAETPLERVSILGGVPEKIPEIDSAVSVSFSPDGKQIVFTESNTADGETSLTLANSDGSNQKTLALALNEKRIFATYDTNPVAWSPDGNMIAVAVEEKNENGSSTMAIMLVDPQTGKEQAITKKRWKHAMELTWVDAENLAFYGFDENEKSGNIWIVSRPTGEYYQLTNDASFYQKLSAKDGKLIAIKGNEVARIKIAGFENDLKNFELREVFNESGHIGNVAWSESDSVIYTSASSGKSEIWRVDPDGKTPQQLTVNSNVSGGVSVSPKDGSIVFSADKGDFSTLWLANKNGKNQQQLTFKNEDARASFTADGESVIFQRGTTFGKQTLWKINLNDKKLSQITKTHTSHPYVSKDGKHTAYYFMDNETDSRWRIGIVDNESSEIINKISFPVVVNHRRMTWHPNNDLLTQIFYEGEDAKLLFLPINGGQHKIISGIGKGEIISLDWSKDGKRLLFSQINEIRDVVNFELRR